LAKVISVVNIISLATVYPIISTVTFTIVVVSSIGIISISTIYCIISTITNTLKIISNIGIISISTIYCIISTVTITLEVISSIEIGSSITINIIIPTITSVKIILTTCANESISTCPGKRIIVVCSAVPTTSMKATKIADDLIFEVYSLSSDIFLVIFIASLCSPS
jgi:hypothetical protein